MEKSNDSKNGKIVSFVNMKGGVAKTTLTKELGMYFSEKGNNVLLIDSDPQSNLTQSIFESFKVIESEKIKTVGEVRERLNDLPSINKLYDNSGYMAPVKKDCVIKKLTQNLSIIPGSLTSMFYGKNPNGDLEQALHNFIERENLKNKYDLIFIDCPPTYSSYTVSAILSSDFYLVPVKPDAYSALGIDMLEEVINKIKSSYQDTFRIKPIKNLGIIFTMYDSTAKKQQVIKNDIENTKKLKDIYKFKCSFPNYPSLATNKLNYMIVKGNNNELKTSLQQIAEEFIGEINKIEKE